MMMMSKADIKVPASLFSEVEFFINDDLDETTAKETRSLLLLGGAVESEAQGTMSHSSSQSRFSLNRVTHVIAKTEEFPEYRFCTEPTSSEDGESDRPIAVTSEWVRRSAHLGLLQKERHYSCLRNMIFSGLCVAAISSKMVRADREVLGNVVPAYGGMWREDVYGDVNVLLTSSLASKKVASFLRQNSANLILAAPNWINDSWRARKLLPLGDYQFDVQSGRLPTCLTGASPIPSASSPTPARSNAAASPAPDKTVFKNKSILLSRDIGRASDHQLRSLEHFVRSAGGTVRRAPNELIGIAQAVRNSDYIVCRYRDVQEYREAIRQKKVVANLAWLISVISNDTLTDPKDEPLHYPIPRTEIPDFKGLSVTITSYRGEQRAYIVKLIRMLGATFDGTLTRTTDLCVAANMRSEKTLKARDWGIPIVNHRYIVDCFLAWSAVERENLKYIDFPDGVDYGAEVGTAKVTDESLGPWILDALDTDEPSDLPVSDGPMEITKTSLSSTSNEAPVGGRADSDLVAPEAVDSGVQAEQAPRPILSDIGASIVNQDVPSKSSPSPRKRKVAEAMIETPSLKLRRHKSEEAVEQQTELTSEAGEDTLDSHQPTTRSSRSSRSSSPAKSPERGTRIVTSNYNVKKEDVTKLRKLGIQVVEKIEDADMLVTPKLSRSPKMLYAIAKGSIDIIQPSWVDACLRADAIVSTAEHHLEDRAGEKSYSVKLEEILERRSAFAGGIYEGHHFWLARGVDEGGSFKALILAAGGVVLSGPRDEELLMSDPDHYHFVVDEGHKVEWKDLLGQVTAKGEPLRLYKRELISDSVFTQQLRWDYQYIDLENEAAPTTPKNKRQGRASTGQSATKRSRARIST